MANLFDLLTQNDEKTNSLLSSQTDYKDIAAQILGSRKKKQKKATKYIAGALLLGLGDIFAQRKASKKYDEFMLSDSVARSKIKQEFEDYTNFMAKHNNYTSGGQRNWEEGLKTDIINRYKDLSSEKINDIYNTEANKYSQSLNRYTTGKFEGSLKSRKTYEELLAPYEEIAVNAKKKLSPDNAGFLKNIFGNVAGTREDADTVLKNAKLQTEQYFSSFNSAIANTEKKYGIKVEEYLSDSEQLNRRINEIKNRIINKQENNIELNRDDFTDAISVGFNPSGFTDLDNLMTTDVPLLIESLQAEKALRSRGVDNPREYLSPKQIAMLGRVFPETQEEIDAQKQKNDSTERNRAASAINSQMQRLLQSEEVKDKQLYAALNGLDGEFTFDEKGNVVATKEYGLLIDNIIEGSVALQNLDPITYKDSRTAFQKSFELQMEGIKQVGKKGGFIMAPANIYGTEYVDPKVVTTPIVPETGSTIAEYLNDYNYLQRIIKDDTGQSATPDKVGKQLIFSDEENNYEVKFTVTEDEDKNLVWVYNPQ